MKIETETLKRDWYVSDVDETIRTLDEKLKDIILEADKRPVVYEIVRGTRSKAWGKNAHHYLACGKGDNVNDILYRAGILLNYATLDRISPQHGVPEDNFFGWSARFTIEHYHDGLRGGFFQQFDGQYTRGCATVDFTHETRDEVIDRFIKWCGAAFETREVRVDHKTVRTYKAQRGATP